MPTLDHLWNEDEAGRYLSVSPWTIRSWRQKGLIGYVQVGGVFRYVPEEIKQYALRGRKPPKCSDCGENAVTCGEILLPGEVKADEPRYFSDLQAESEPISIKSA
jgi:hypothetical protein